MATASSASAAPARARPSPSVGSTSPRCPSGCGARARTSHPTFLRHMYEYGTTSEQVAHVKAAHSKHASQNPKALLKERVTVADVVGSRWIVTPLHLLDCCLETEIGRASCRERV